MNNLPVLHRKKKQNPFPNASMLLASLIIGFANNKPALACSFGALDYVKAGETVTGVVNKFGGCGGEVIMTRYSSTIIPEGIVMCAKASRDSTGRKILIVNSHVAEIREGMNENEPCTW